MPVRVRGAMVSGWPVHACREIDQREKRENLRHFLIDTDTASDDALALVMALNDPGVTVGAVTIVAGNVPLDQAVQNALYVVDLCGKNVPVYAGRPKPLLRELVTAQSTHGQDGMGNIGLSLSGREPVAGSAMEAMTVAVDRFETDLTLVTLGPLTNVAIALLADPSIASRIGECVVMGGIGLGHGNVVPAAEYNIWVDPDAAQIVFD